MLLYAFMREIQKSNMSSVLTRYILSLLKLKPIETPCGAGVELASLKREVAGSSLRSDMGFSLPEGVNKTQLRTLGGVRPKDSRP